MPQTLTDKIPVDWKSLIYRGVESDELDYKAAMNWNRLTRPEELRGFEWEGFALDESRSTDTHLLFTA